MEAALLPPTTNPDVSVEDYWEQLLLSLSPQRGNWPPRALPRRRQGTRASIYDKKTVASDYRVGDWVLVKFPHEETGKHRKTVSTMA